MGEYRVYLSKETADYLRKMGGDLSEGIEKATELHQKSRGLKKAIKNLLAWVPGTSRPSDYAEMKGLTKEDVEPSDGIPFVSESFLYVALSKYEARTFLYLVGEVIKLAGFDMFELEMEVNQEESTKKKR